MINNNDGKTSDPNQKLPKKHFKGPKWYFLVSGKRQKITIQSEAKPNLINAKQSLHIGESN